MYKRSIRGYMAFTIGFMAFGCFFTALPRMILTTARLGLDYHVERMCSWAHMGHGSIGSLFMVGLMLLCLTFLYQGFIRFKTHPFQSSIFYALTFILALSKDSFVICS